MLPCCYHIKKELAKLETCRFREWVREREVDSQIILGAFSNGISQLTALIG